MADSHLGWIRVEDGLPPVDPLSHCSADVLCARLAPNCNMRAVGHYFDGKNPDYKPRWFNDKRDFEPTHWMYIEPLNVQDTQPLSIETQIQLLINEVAPPPLVVSETAIRQMQPLLVELIERRKKDGHAQ